MKNMKKLSIIGVPSMFVIVLAFSNCGRMGDLNHEGSEDLSSMHAEETVVDSEKLGLPYALLSAEQTLASMVKVANVTAPSASVLNEYNNRYGALAAGNDLSMANAPLILGATSLAGEVCANLVNQERALAADARSFFGPVNFMTGATSVNDAAFATAVRGMARSFWGRSENTEESAMLNTFKNEFIEGLPAASRTQAASTSNLLIGTCAAMLSSVEAITY